MDNHWKNLNVSPQKQSEVRQLRKDNDKEASKICKDKPNIKS